MYMILTESWQWFKSNLSGKKMLAVSLSPKKILTKLIITRNHCSFLPATWPWYWLQWRSYACLRCKTAHRLQLKFHLAIIAGNAKLLSQLFWGIATFPSFKGSHTWPCLGRTVCPTARKVTLWRKDVSRPDWVVSSVAPPLLASLVWTRDLAAPVGRQRYTLNILYLPSVNATSVQLCPCSVHCPTELNLFLHI